MPNECFYDEVSDQGFISVPKSDDSESGIVVFKLTYFDVYLPQTMSNHATDINEKAQMANFNDFRSPLLKTQKKRNCTDTIYNKFI